MIETILPHFRERYYEEKQHTKTGRNYTGPKIFGCRECGPRLRFYDRFEHDTEFHKLIPPSPFAVRDRLIKMHETLKALFE